MVVWFYKELKRLDMRNLKPVLSVVGGIALLTIFKNKVVRNYLVELVIDAGAEVIKLKLKGR